MILDGELVAVDVKGQPVFYEPPAAVASKPSRVTARLIYYAFDLLYLDGCELRGLPLVERKQLLEALLDNARGLQLIKYIWTGRVRLYWTMRGSWTWKALCRSAPTLPTDPANAQSGLRRNVQLGVRRTEGRGQARH